MTRTLAAAALLSLAACTAQQQSTALATPAGALFCAIHKSGGGQVIVTLVNTAAAGAAGATPAGAAGAGLVVLATGASKALVDGACDQAAKSAGGTAGVPVAPPADQAGVGQVAVSLPQSP